ncbi:macoilin-1-like [Hydractinia symbiolongicarpus]|uniref:macoilin-1-like n=1 Tax=Hydractinia symbiolongicarpus TaxID=13093 RepID=UPI00254BB588|nr:macoilin-1-like [Hydractinia symbiolongicarpus]
MKRRTIDPSKLRRPVKRSRITDSVNGSWFLYLRFFIVWLLIITVDFLLEFRFEFLWPFWLLIRSSFDSFRYQGMGLTLLFLVFTLFSDILCFLFLPVPWLFFVASTYVWVQFVCNTERGPCIATISLWLVFVYVEASVRLREIKAAPFHLDLCRPFAAHCIGYPVVSLGYGFKSYVGYKVKNYKQTEVGKKNSFYHELVSYALPVEMQDTNIQQKKALTFTNGINTKTDIESILSTEARKRGLKLTDIEERQGSSPLSLNDLEVIANVPVKKNSVNIEPSEMGFVKVPSRNGKFSNGDLHSNYQKKSKHSKKSVESEDELSDSTESSTSSRISYDNSPKTAKDIKYESLQSKLKEEQLSRRKAEQQVSQFECETRRLRSELNNVRQAEMELKTQVNASLISERYLKAELEQLKSDNESLQLKINSMSSSKSQDKSLISSLERKLKLERENRANVELQLKESKKKSSKLEADSIVAPRAENHDACHSRRQELEYEISKLQSKLDESAQNINELQKENDNAKKKNSEKEREKMKKDVEFLTGALNAMQGKNLHLESSLSSETRLKLDLFSALGETRRQLEIVQGQMKVKCSEVDALKLKIAEVMAVMPQEYNSSLAGLVSSNANATHMKSNGIDSIVTTSSYMPAISQQNGL